MSDLSIKDKMDYAMKHFSFIADQRVKTFNFYIIILAASTGATITASQRINQPAAFVATGVFHVFFAFIFWMIDKRSRRLLLIAKDGLRTIEESESWPSDCRLAVRDHQELAGFKNWFFSFTMAFRITFLGQFLFGLLVIYCGLFVKHGTS